MNALIGFVAAVFLQGMLGSACFRSARVNVRCALIVGALVAAANLAPISRQAASKAGLSIVLLAGVASLGWKLFHDLRGR
jgi:hypothetical protein